MKRLSIMLGLAVFLGAPAAALAQDDKRGGSDDDFLFDNEALDEEEGSAESDPPDASDDAPAFPKKKDAGESSTAADDRDPIPGLDDDGADVEKPLEEVLDAEEGPLEEPDDPAERARIETGIEEIRRRAEETKERLGDPTEVTEEEVEEQAGRTDEAIAAARAERRGGEASAVADAGGGEVPARGRGAPVELEPVPSHGETSSTRVLGEDPSAGLGASGGEAPTEGGEAQHGFFEKLLGAVIKGVGTGVQAGLQSYRRRMAQERVNELKALSDRLALQSRIQDRPYVDQRVRRAIAASGLGRKSYDPRLDDLILGGNRGGSLRGSSGSGSSSGGQNPTRVGGVNVDTGGSAPNDVPRLPRVRDPITGNKRVVIDMPLGADPVTPLRPN